MFRSGSSKISSEPPARSRCALFCLSIHIHIYPYLSIYNLTLVADFYLCVVNALSHCPSLSTPSLQLATNKYTTRLTLLHFAQSGKKQH